MQERGLLNFSKHKLQISYLFFWHVRITFIHVALKSRYLLLLYFWLDCCILTFLILIWYLLIISIIINFCSHLSWILTLHIMIASNSLNPCRLCKITTNLRIPFHCCLASTALISWVLRNTRSILFKHLLLFTLWLLTSKI